MAYNPIIISLAVNRFRTRHLGELWKIDHLQATFGDQGVVSTTSQSGRYDPLLTR